MADVPNQRSKIQEAAVDPSAPVSQFLFTKMSGNINEIIEGFKKVSFLTAGVHNWTCPEGLQRVLVRMCGGGGGGSTGFDNTGGQGTNGGGGGQGCNDEWRILDVTPSTVYTLTVGAGGAAGSATIATNQYGAGGNGGDTIFDSLWTVRGGAGGAHAGTVSDVAGYLLNTPAKYTAGGQGVHTNPLANSTPPFAGFSGQSNATYQGGVYASGGGGGGAGAGGNGGAGGTAGVPGGAGAGYGAGGGGGSPTLDAGYLGGAGASGFIEIYYV